MKKIQKGGWLVMIVAALGACATGSSKPEATGVVKVSTLSMGAVLTREEAVLRARQIRNVTYNLWMDLSREADVYDGRVVVFFELRKPPKESLKKFHLDFTDGKIRSLNLNGLAQTDVQIAKRYDGKRIHFSPDEVQLGMNRIEIAFSHAFGKNGSGLYRFVDSVDDRTYIYSNFEPYSANEAFPCFDQPDLKASFELTVEVPDGWNVISNTMDREVSRVDGRKSWAFPPSPRLSTYLYAIHAGEFKEFKKEENGIGVRLFVRHSVAHLLRGHEWFSVLGKGLDFFGVQFGYPYPYSKYDLVIVPDLPGNAVESAAAVAISEETLFRGAPTREELNHRENLLLHELAHMWFGNLVTPRWWNGLWLNESFAGFAAAWAQEEAGNRDAWLSFFYDLKRWAYFEDQRSTTHPVDVGVLNTDEARANFDGVTYGKGAAILKQLRFFLGEDDFREGLQRYFQAFALRNSSLTEFVKILGQASGQDLSLWRKNWFQTVGVNTLRVEWRCVTPAVPTQEDLAAKFPKMSQKKLRKRLKSLEEQGPVIQKMVLRQEAVQGGAGLVPHKIRLGFFSDGGARSKIVQDETVDAVYSGAETVLESAAGLACPDYVIPNLDDQDYVRPLLDLRTEAWVKENLHRFEDPLLRAILWNGLWEQVLSGRLSPKEYGELSLKFLKPETKSLIVDSVLETLGDSMLGSQTVLKFLTGNERAGFRRQLESFLRNRILSLPSGDLQRVMFRRFLQVAGEPESLQWIDRLLKGGAKLAGHGPQLRNDPDLRWLALASVARSGREGADDSLATETEKDESSLHFALFGERLVHRAQLQLPREAVKKMWWHRLVRQGDEAEDWDYPRLEEALEYFHVLGQEDLSRMFVEPYFSALTAMSASEEDEGYFADVAAELYPHLCDPTVVEKTTRLLASGKFPAEVTRALLVAREEEERCLLIRKIWPGN